MVIICPWCEGDGTWPFEEPCVNCGGDGEININDLAMASVSREVQHKVMFQIAHLVMTEQSNAIAAALAVAAKIDALVAEISPDSVFDSYIIFENTDSGEYNALTDAQKEKYRLLLSAGKVSLVDGSQGRSLLMSLFGPGSATRANLIALLGG
jgi:RecJ-like exonuclease